MDTLKQLVKFGQANQFLRLGQSSGHRDFFKATIEIFPRDFQDVFKQNATGREDEVIELLYEGVKSVVDELKESFHSDKVANSLIRYGFPAKANISFVVDRGIVVTRIDFNSYEHIQAEDLVEIGKTAVWRELLGVDLQKHLRECVSCNRLFLASHGKKESCSSVCAKNINYSKAKEKPGYDLRKRLENQKCYLERVRGKAWIKKHLRIHLAEKWKNEGVPEELITNILRSKRGRPKKAKTP